MIFRYCNLLLIFFFANNLVHTQSIAENPPVTSKIILQTTTSWDGVPITYPEGEAKVTALLIEISPGESTGWHKHPVPSFAYILNGTLEVTLDYGESKQFTKGDAVAEVTNTIHSGQNIGEEVLQLVVFYTGIRGKDLTVIME
ncbi:MAG: cupin domain-containing protein [Balneolaceae bacterium]|nr:MAG: cupin domain-containing protein [Balneolaceae bacterium]